MHRIMEREELPGYPEKLKTQMSEKGYGMDVVNVTELKTYSPTMSVYVFDICAPSGPDQFIPQYSATYIVNVYILNPDGSVAALGSTRQFSVKCEVEPIFTKRTSDFVYLSVDNYLNIDLGGKRSVKGFGAAYVQDSRYYQWQLYGTNDKDLPLCKWDFLGEKSDTTASSRGMYNIEVSGGEYRYLRICTSYASSRWTALYSEISVTTDEVGGDKAEK